MDLADRIQLTLSTFISWGLLIGAGISLYEQQWFNAFLALLTFVLSYVPALIARSFKIYLPIELEFLFFLLLFGSIYLGSVNSYYEIFWWWDKMLHAFSGILLGIVGFILIYILNSEPKVHMHLSPFFVGFFSFLFSVAIGTLWEVFEFLVDSVSVLSMQSGPFITDTMVDLILDASGGFLIALIGYFYVKKVPVPLVDRWVTKFVEKNPLIFRPLKLWKERRILKKIRNQV